MRRPTVREAHHLRAACAAPDGCLTSGVSRRLLTAMLEAGFVYAEDGDGFRVTARDDQAQAACHRIDDRGRLSVLSDSQRRTLVERVLADGRFASSVSPRTAQALAALGLAEYRDTGGRILPEGGGVRASVSTIFRTALGDRIATLAVAGP